MSIIDNTNPKHVLAWEHTLIDWKTRFFCSCGDYEHLVPTPPTIRDAEFAQRVAIEKFNDHVANLGKADKDIVSDAVIVNETLRPTSDEAVFKEISPLSNRDKRWKGTIYENTPNGRDESFWRDAKTGERIYRTPNDGGFAEFAHASHNNYFGKYGNVPLRQRVYEGADFDERMRRAASGTTTTTVNIEVDGGRMIDRLRETIIEMERKYPGSTRR